MDLKLLLLQAFLYALFVEAARGSVCRADSPLVGAAMEIGMSQHQLRGQIQILDDCSFRVTKFDMIEGRDVHWWGALGEDFYNLTNGFVVSEQPLNRTFRNETFDVVLAFHTWDEIRVLGVWDKAFASDFGHVLLAQPINTTSPASLAPAPSPQSLSLPPSITWGIRQPTMFENCIALAPYYRLRWTLNPNNQTVDLGLEAAVTEMQYMAFGWANPKDSNNPMLHADVIVAGFKSRHTPFADDYYISQYSECTWEKDNSTPTGVCPDYVYLASENNTSVNNSILIHGQRLDGVSLIRYQRNLESLDWQFDVAISAMSSMKVIWAMGPLKPPDSLKPLYLPGNHGGPPGVTFGHLDLNISAKADQCTGPLVALNVDEGELLMADTGSPIVVTLDVAAHYPNPPNPEKVFILNKLEAPVLKVERGVPVTFSVQAGHDVSFCITSDPIGGSSITNRTVFAGGPEAHGVPANPYDFTWLPNRNTPDEVFYQSFFEKKMGWKVQVVDGGLTDMYNSSVFLAGQTVTLFWTFTDTGISFAVRGERKSGYVAIGFGEGMVNCFTYVGWVDGSGICRVSTYWIDGKDAASIHPTNESLTDVKCRREKGNLIFEFSRSLEPACNEVKECKKNVIDPSIPLKVVWAMGTFWNDDQLTEHNMHSAMSRKYMSVQLTKGVAEAEQDLLPVLAVHGFMMYLAWGLLLPGGILAARYLKHLKDDGWFHIHVYSQYSGIAVMLLGLLFAFAELQTLNTKPVHVKLGLTSIVLACVQPVNAFVRPKKTLSGGKLSPKRFAWELVHKYSGRAAMFVGFASLMTGISQLGSKYDGMRTEGLMWALLGWFMFMSLLVAYLEYHERRNRRLNRGITIPKGDWVMTNNEEDDTADLLQSSPTTLSVRNYGDVQLYPSRGMEVQLEALR